MTICQLRKTCNGRPVAMINRKLFPLDNLLLIHEALEELRSLNTGLEIKFESFRQFNDLLNQIDKPNFSDLTSIPTEQLLNEINRRIGK